MCCFFSTTRLANHIPGFDDASEVSEGDELQEDMINNFASGVPWS
jgi:hypothetical protein